MKGIVFKFTGSWPESRPCRAFFARSCLAQSGIPRRDRRHAKARSPGRIRPGPLPSLCPPRPPWFKLSVSAFPVRSLWIFQRPTLPDFPPILALSQKLPRSSGQTGHSLSCLFIRVNGRKSVAILFLNCTKNTELTRARFARTVTFAFINFPVVPAGRNRLATAIQNFSRKIRRRGAPHEI
jgi:hypothetical protein